MPSLAELLFIRRDEHLTKMVSILRDNPLVPNGTVEILRFDLTLLPEVSGYVGVPDWSQLIPGRVYPVKSLQIGV